MRIVSDDPKLLDEIYNDLNNKKMEIEKGTKKLDGAYGDISIYIDIANLTLVTIGTLFTYLSYRQSQKNNYIHFKYKENYNNGIELKFENLSKEERKEKEFQLGPDILDKKLEYIYAG